MTWPVLPQKNCELQPFKNIYHVSCVTISHQQYRSLQQR